MTDEEADRLAAVAVDLIQRVRDDAPEANWRWLTATLTNPDDWFSLCFVLAAAVPDDRSWRALTAWLQDPSQFRGPKPCGTRAAYRRHRYRGEEPCDPCSEEYRRWERDRKRDQRASVMPDPGYPQPVDV